MATDPFDSLTLRLTNTVTRRRGLGVLGLLGMANMPLPDEASAKKKRKKNKKKKGQTSTTPAPTTTSTTTQAPGTCGAVWSNCGTVQTPCICAASPTDLEHVRCISPVIFTLDDCLADSECAGGNVCIIDMYQEHSACVALCSP